MKNIKDRRDVISTLNGNIFSSLGRCKHCKGRDGRAKNLYESKADAKDAAGYLQTTVGVRLKAYRCLYSNSAWHITKDLDSIPTKAVKNAQSQGPVTRRPNRQKPDPKNVWKITKSGVKKVNLTPPGKKRKS
jgi:hypothetical protein